MDTGTAKSLPQVNDEKPIQVVRACPNEFAERMLVHIMEGDSVGVSWSKTRKEIAGIGVHQKPFLTRVRRSKIYREKITPILKQRMRERKRGF